MAQAGEASVTVGDPNASTAQMSNSSQQPGMLHSSEHQRRQPRGERQRWEQPWPESPGSESHSDRHSRTYRASSARGSAALRARFAPSSNGRAPVLQEVFPVESVALRVASGASQLSEQTEHVAAAAGHQRSHQRGTPRAFGSGSVHRGGANRSHRPSRGGRLSEVQLIGGASVRVSDAELEHRASPPSVDRGRPPLEPAPSSAEASRGGINQRTQSKRKKHAPRGAERHSVGPYGHAACQLSAATDHGPGGAAAAIGLGAASWESGATATGPAICTSRPGRGAGRTRRYQNPDPAFLVDQQQANSYSMVEHSLSADVGRPKQDSVGNNHHHRQQRQLNDQRGRERQAISPFVDEAQLQCGPRPVGCKEQLRRNAQEAVPSKPNFRSSAQRLTANGAAALGAANSDEWELQLVSSDCPPVDQPLGLGATNKSRDALAHARARNGTGSHGQASFGTPSGHDRSMRTQVWRPTNGQQPAEPSESQLDLLTSQLWSNSLECMICCSVVRIDVAVWSCLSCYHIFHLFCIKKWASAATSAGPGSSSSSNTNGLCPACRVPFAAPPTQYLCFCGQMRDPPVNRHEVPHSCGEVCVRKRNCAHGCTLLCHPGPCPPCRARALQSCQCGKMQEVRSCNSPGPLRCRNECGKLRACGRHVCKELCHAGTCPPCMEQLEQACHCPRRTTRLVFCPSAASDTSALGFSCGLTCGQLLNCGKHACTRPCHSGPCPPCSRLPTAVTHCPCGRFELLNLPLAKPRSACMDQIPTCGSLCKKRLPCYQESNGRAEKHVCLQLCHDGICGPCKDDTVVSCNCGSELKSLKCSTLTIENGEIKMPEFVCSKRCNAKMSCSRHKCSRLCCKREVAGEEEVHTCLQVCGRLLSCGLHRCDELCHRGQCRPCLHASFDELRCHCGAEVIYPPVPCSTKPPDCSKPCQRSHDCDHPVMHNCHPDSEPCTRCVAFTQKWCVGQHELMANVPCFLAEMACGRTCAKLLPCGVHTCTRTCHKGDCLIDGKPCSQPCATPRPDCGHACGVPCHGSQPCISSATCVEPVELKCLCGLRSGKVPCNAGTPSGQFSRISASLLAVKLSQATSGKVLDVGDEVYSVLEQDSGIVASAKEGASRRRLKCDEQCSITERNRRFALALEIENPDLAAKLSVPAYSDFVRSFTQRDPAFVAQIEKALNNLVMQSKQDKRQYLRQLVHSFPPMNYDRRRLIHELAAFYGCTSESQDCEPNKSVVVTAVRHKCWMPSVTLLTAVQKDLHPKPPPPISYDAHDEEAVRTRASALKSSMKSTSESTADTVDYFDVTD